MCLAVPGQVQSIYEAQGTRMGIVNFGGVEKEVCLAYLPDIQVGDYTIVHVGFAISRLDEESARKTLQTFAQLGLLEEELEELRATDSPARSPVMDKDAAVSADGDHRSIHQGGVPR